MRGFSITQEVQTTRTLSHGNNPLNLILHHWDPLAVFIRVGLYTDSIPAQLQNHTHTHTQKHVKTLSTRAGSKKGGQKVRCLRFKSACLDGASGIDGLPGMFAAAPGTLTRQTPLFSTGNLVKGCASMSVCVSQPRCVLERLEHSVAALLHICLTAVTTGQPQLSL